jgi:hypothetical protein
MQIRKGSYSSLEWVDALAARAKKADIEAEIASSTEEEAAQNALQRTAQIAFGDNETKVPGPDERLGTASRNIQDKVAKSKIDHAISAVKAKLAARGIDPVTLGIVKDKREWDGMDDLDRVDEVAKLAAIKFAKELSRQWEHQSSSTKASAFDAETSRMGRIMPATAAGDDSVGRPSRVPSNANSILDPGRLDRAAAENNEHDEAIKAAKKRATDREAEKRADMAPKDLPEDIMKSGRVIASGGQDSTANVHRVPRNQLSILDNVDGKNLSPEDLKKKLQDIFASRIPDTQGAIREANEKRREAIQKPKEQDRSWEKPSKATSTSELSKRLMNLWVPEGGK